MTATTAVHPIDEVPAARDRHHLQAFGATQWFGIRPGDDGRDVRCGGSHGGHHGGEPGSEGARQLFGSVK